MLDSMISFDAIQAVLCDFDGTLVDSLTVMMNAYSVFAARNCFTPDINEFNALNGPSLHEIVLYLKNKHKIQQHETFLIKQYNTIINDLYIENVYPYEDSLDFLEILRCRDIPSYLVTSSSRDIALKWLRQNGWEDLFAGYVFGDDVKKSKPDDAIYRFAIDVFGLDSSTSIAIEDSVNGIISARTAGLPVIGVRGNSKEHITAGATNYFQSISEVAKEFLR